MRFRRETIFPKPQFSKISRDWVEEIQGGNPIFAIAVGRMYEANARSDGKEGIDQGKVCH
ncbi:MAG: hypothetical protein C4516_05610 [Oxalobacter sp.]|nr:MAG: hypothetical protein C4516_05610 [Oxalobacter sp.]